MIQFCILLYWIFLYTRPAVLNFFSLVGIVYVCVHEVDRKDTEHTVQYVQSDQGLFLGSAIRSGRDLRFCVKGMATKDAMQYIQSYQGLFVAGATCTGYENSAEQDLPMRTSSNRDIYYIRDMKAYTPDRHACI